MAQRIIVIDDAPEIVELYQDIFADEGYQVVAFGEPIDDPRELEGQRPDLIILDWLFGREAAGMRVLDRLVEYPPTAAIPVIVCTAAPMLPAQVEGMLEARGVEVVPKPFKIEYLLAVVRRSLNGRRPSPEVAAAA